MTSPLTISILIDNPQSWFVPYGTKLRDALRAGGHTVHEIAQAEDIPQGDCAFFLSCEQIIPSDIRSRNTHNLVIHASKLPAGKGWSPLTWQILEGKNDIPLSLFEAEDKVDNGPIYGQETIVFEGHELIDELRKKEGEAIIALALRFVEAYPPDVGVPQTGEESFYPRRRPKDSELDIQKPLVELFNNLRVADNERYPAFFVHKGHTYVLKIYKKEE